MKKELIGLVLGLAVISCDSIIEDTSPTGTTIVVKNNTFGVRDFDVASFKKYPIAFGSFDYGRNFGGNDYQDSIGYIEFRKDQTGTIYFYNQDTIQIKGEFQFGFWKHGGEQYIDIEFEGIAVKTYVNKEPLYTFGYSKVNDSTWVFNGNLQQYSGRYKWIGNQIFSW